MAPIDYEFYETADPFTHYLAEVLRVRCYGGIHGRHCFEPCVGNGAIVRAFRDASGDGVAASWRTNDLDPRWLADTHEDATGSAAWAGRRIDWTVSNTPFTQAIAIADQALTHSRIGVALYLRASIHEPLNEGPRRTWFREHPPTGIIYLPRFAHQRSRKTGKWTTDSMTSCWVVWEHHTLRQWIDYAPESVIEATKAYTPGYRAQMDALNGLTGTEAERQAQWRNTNNAH